MKTVNSLNMNSQDIENIYNIMSLREGTPESYLGVTSEGILYKKTGILDDRKVLSSNEDGYADYIYNKMIPGKNISISKGMEGMALPPNEKITISSKSPESFLELTDTPTSYSGNAGKMLKVNSSANALETADEIKFSNQTAGPYTTYLCKMFDDATNFALIQFGDIYLGTPETGTKTQREISFNSSLLITRNLSTGAKQVGLAANVDLLVDKLKGTGDRYIGADSNGKAKEMPAPVQGQKKLLESDHTITDVDSEITGLRLQKTGNKVHIKYRLFTGTHTLSLDTLTVKNQLGTDLGASLHLVDVTEMKFDEPVVNVKLMPTNLVFTPGLTGSRLYEININLIDTESTEIRLHGITAAGNTTIIKGYLSSAEITNYS